MSPVSKKSKAKETQLSLVLRESGATPKKAMQSVAGKGLVFARNTGTNQDEALVFSFVSSVFVDCRPV